jgi:hypothetical protein
MAFSDGTGPVLARDKYYEQNMQRPEEEDIFSFD